MITKFLATIIFLSMCAVMPGSFSNKLKDCPKTKGIIGHNKTKLFRTCYKLNGKSMIPIKKSKVCNDTYVPDTIVLNGENRPCIWRKPNGLEKAITRKFCIPDPTQTCVPNTSK